MLRLCCHLVKVKQSLHHTPPPSRNVLVCEAFWRSPSSFEIGTVALCIHHGVCNLSIYLSLLWVAAQLGHCIWVYLRTCNRSGSGLVHGAICVAVMGTSSSPFTNRISSPCSSVSGLALQRVGDDSLHQD